MRYVALTITLCGLVLLAVHPESRFYPACPVYAWFHVLCPGCGATRALAALLRGDWAMAWRMNALFVCAVPGLMVYAARAYLGTLREDAFVLPVPRWALLGLSFAVVSAFTVARNLFP